MALCVTISASFRPTAVITRQYSPRDAALPDQSQSDHYAPANRDPLALQPLCRLLGDDAQLDLGQAAQVVDEENDLVLPVVLELQVGAFGIRRRGDGGQELVDEFGGGRDRRDFADPGFVVLCVCILHQPRTGDR